MDSPIPHQTDTHAYPPPAQEPTMPAEAPPVYAPMTNAEYVPPMTNAYPQVTPSIKQTETRPEYVPPETRQETPPADVAAGNLHLILVDNKIPIF